MATYGGQVAPESSAGDTPADDPFAAELAANSAYAHEFALGGLEPVAARGLAVVTCMDSRIEPLQMLGLRPGDAKILRNAVLASPEMSCALSCSRCTCSASAACSSYRTPAAACRPKMRVRCTPPSSRRPGWTPEASSLRPAPDAVAALRQDIQRIRSSPYLPRDLAVGGAIYDVDSGRLSRVV